MEKIRILYKKYRTSILVFCFLIVISQFVIPSQMQLYTRASIKAFKGDYLLPLILIPFFGVFLYKSVALWRKYRNHTAIIKHRWVRIVLGGFLPQSVVFALVLFWVQDVFFGLAFFINRLSTHGAFERTYVVQYLTDATQTEKEALYLSDIATKELSHDKVLQDYVYNPQLKNFDTVHVIYKTGLLGVPLPDPGHVKK